MALASPYPDVEIPNLPVPEFVLAAGRESPDTPALIDGLKGDTITHGQLSAYVDRVAANLHAATVVGLADTACGLATRALLPEGASGFTTIELKTNFLGTARDGRIVTVATNVHAGRTTQVWDAVVTNEGTGKTVALFRCTQSVLWPR